MEDRNSSDTLFTDVPVSVNVCPRGLLNRDSLYIAVWMALVS
jgi:hypothetical protein